MKKLGVIWDDRRFWMHVPIGVAIVILALYVHWIASFSMTWLFTFYELSEDWKLKDGAWIDIQGGIGGILFTGIGYIVWLIITT